MGRAGGKYIVWRRGGPAIVLALATVLAQTASASGADIAIVPETKLRMTVIQWMPVEGEYRKIDTMSGDLVVRPDGTVSVPVIGSVTAVGKDVGAISADVAERIRSKLGLITVPEVGLDVIEYPPIYVVGAVATPGQFPFRPGFTVLQALALGGGQLRAESETRAESEISIRSEMVGIGDDIVRTLARCARLRAVTEGKDEVVFPEEVTSRQDSPPVRELMAQERALFTARAGALDRQSQSFEDLVTLLTAEIGALEERASTLDENLASLQKELDGVNGLVQSGLATVSRRTDIERLISNIRADRLDQTTAILRGRQGISEAERNRSDLADRTRTEAAQELIEQEAKLEDLYLKRETTRQLLAEMSARTSLAGNRDLGEPVLTFSIVRHADSGTTETPANEFTDLMPGDVLKVALSAASFQVGAGR